ncbi:MAG: hypothetical protein LBK66_08660 [Spirochaetaceae bacterium]|jgi:hypothetical protein|nr:hypothetical protein [Spirochaetaceae bacterium]
MPNAVFVVRARSKVRAGYDGAERMRNPLATETRWQAVCLVLYYCCLMTVTIDLIDSGVLKLLWDVEFCLI